MAAGGGAMSSAMVIGVSALLFIVGAIGVIVRRNALSLVLSIQLLFAASLLVLAAHDRRAASTPADPALDGSVFAWVVLAAMATELAVGIAVATSLVRHHDSLDVERASEMRR